MAGSWASGRNAERECDRCGWTFSMREMRKEKGTKWTVCRECYDVMDRVNHPQNKPIPASPDPQALRNPRNPEVILTWSQIGRIPWKAWTVYWYIWGEMS